jgi:hypothetical protein
MPNHHDPVCVELVHLDLDLILTKLEMQEFRDLSAEAFGCDSFRHG